MITPRMSTRVATNPATSTSSLNLPASLFGPGNNKRTLDHAQQLRDRGFVVLDDDEWRLPAALVEDAVRDPNPRRQPTTLTHDPWGTTSQHNPDPQP